jgi:hypothetical protein
LEEKKKEKKGRYFHLKIFSFKKKEKKVHTYVPKKNSNYISPSTLTDLIGEVYANISLSHSEQGSTTKSLKTNHSL